MITLKEAINLCGWDDEFYLKVEKGESDCFFTAKAIKEKFDTDKITVVRVAPFFSMFGDYLGMLLVVRGITEDELKRLEV